MFASAQNTSSISLGTLKPSNAKAATKRRDLLVDASATLLWPAFATGSLIFGSSKEAAYATAPYKSEIKLSN